MKITFIYPDFAPEFLHWPGGFYTGIASLSAVLKQAGHQTSLLHITRPINRSDFISKIANENPDLIGFSSTSHMAPLIREMASWLVEAKLKIPSVYGGIHPTIAPEESIGIEGIDMICRGEGEAPIVELCRKLERKEDTSDIANLWTKNDGQVTKNPIRPLHTDLDTLPFPDRSIFAYQSLIDEREGRAVILASRGCPYNCSYCCNHLFRKLYAGKGNLVRFRSVDNLISEIRQMLDTYPFITSLNFHDDILFVNKKWLAEFAEKYGREVHLPFICNLRADVTDADLVGLLKRAGCSHVKIGLESGNAHIRYQVLNRHMTNDHIKSAFQICKAAGLITVSFNMVGIPYETPAAILETIKLNATIQVDLNQVSIYQPYIGTRLGEICREQHFMQSTELAPTFYSSTVLRLNTVTAAQVLMFRNYFKLLVHCYRSLSKLPPALSRNLIRPLDRLLSSYLTSRFLNAIYIPFSYLNRAVLLLRMRARIALNKITKVPQGGVLPTLAGSDSCRSRIEQLQ